MKSGVGHAKSRKTVSSAMRQVNELQMLLSSKVLAINPEAA